MRDTRHGRKRRSQRGYTSDILELIRDLGGFHGDRQTLDRRDAGCIVETLTEVIKVSSRMKAQFLRLLDKGGGTAVFGEADQLVTVFNPDTYRRRKRRSRRAASRLKWA
jgi:hypothetical protein